MARCGPVLVVYGTRPELIKLAPVIAELKSRDVECLLLSTRQHTDLLASVERYFRVKPHITLKRRDRPLADRLRYYTTSIEKILEERKDASPIQCVVVQGDTLTALAGAMAGFYSHVPVLHVEAGLRTGNPKEPWPEESHRRAISAFATWHCVPTTKSHLALLRESTPEDRVVLTGNTVTDAVRYACKELSLTSHKYVRKYGWAANYKLILVTGHRRENIGKRLQDVVATVCNMARQHPDAAILWILHPNPEVRKPIEVEFLRQQMKLAKANAIDRVRFEQPAPYEEFVWLMTQAACIVTDSGGIQEEAAEIKVPVFLTRETTERPEAAEAGYVSVVGCSPQALHTALWDFLTKGSKPQWGENPFSGPTGNPASCVVDVIEEAIRCG